MGQQQQQQQQQQEQQEQQHQQQHHHHHQQQQQQPKLSAYPSLVRMESEWAESSFGPHKTKGGEKTARRLPPPCCSSRPGLELRAKLREATPAEPLVTKRGGDPSGYGSLRTRENPPARRCHARGVAAHPVTQAVPLTAGAGGETRLAHW